MQMKMVRDTHPTSYRHMSFVGCVPRTVQLDSFLALHGAMRYNEIIGGLPGQHHPPVVLRVYGEERGTS
jgi:hypothetical protein